MAFDTSSRCGPCRTRRWRWLGRDRHAPAEPHVADQRDERRATCSDAEPIRCIRDRHRCDDTEIRERRAACNNLDSLIWEAPNRITVIRGPIAVICLVLAMATARADTRVDELDKTLSTSSSDKARLAAVAALAKIGDKTALKPLVKALHDPSADVRATAVVALGHLGHKAALPSLRELAAGDPDDTVRAKARTDREAGRAREPHCRRRRRRGGR